MLKEQRAQIIRATKQTKSYLILQSIVVEVQTELNYLWFNCVDDGYLLEYFIDSLLCLLLLVLGLLLEIDY